MSLLKTISTEELIQELTIRSVKESGSHVDQIALLKELVSVNEKLVEVEQVKSAFLSNIRNEIVNPLTSIMGLSKSISLHSSQKKKAQLVFQEAFLLDFQLKNIFVAAELESGNLGLSISEIDIPQLLEQLKSRFEHLAEKRNIVIELESSVPQGLFFLSDVEKLGLILSNVLANAIKFSLDDSIVEMKLSMEADKLIITFHDYGVGISKEDEEKIFNRFSQIETGTQKSHLGHGLGLAVTSSLLEIVQGEITFVSSENLGTVFTLKFPQLERQNNDKSISTAENEFLFDGDDTLF